MVSDLHKNHFVWPGTKIFFFDVKKKLKSKIATCSKFKSFTLEHFLIYQICMDIYHGSEIILNFKSFEIQTLVGNTAMQPLF